MRSIMTSMLLWGCAGALPLVGPVAMGAGNGGTAGGTGKEHAALPPITAPIMFNTPEADKILDALQIFPPTSVYNEDISARPVAANSQEMIATTSPRRMACNRDMNYIIIPPNQPRIPIHVVYPENSEPGPYPIPENVPVENWKPSMGNLEAFQRKGVGDCHMIILDPTARQVYEFWGAKIRDGEVDGKTGWRVGNVTKFDLSSNKMRPDGWTSADAAGLSIFATTVKYPDVVKGEVPHVMRVTLKHILKSYVYPATHSDGKAVGANFPRMGERLRLKKSVDISSFSPHAQAIAKGMKKYGLIVADTGLDWLISVSPDERIQGTDDLKKFKSSDFEFVVPTGPKENGRQ